MVLALVSMIISIITCSVTLQQIKNLFWCIIISGLIVGLPAIYLGDSIHLLGAIAYFGYSGGISYLLCLQFNKA